MTGRAEGSQHGKGHKRRSHDQSGHKGHSDSGMSHDGHQVSSDATTPQWAALAGVTSFLLVSGMVLPGFSVNLGLSARDVDASIMPPGMINAFDLPGDAMKDMAAVKPRQVTYRAPP